MSVVQIVGLVESRVAWVWSNATVEEVFCRDSLIVSVKSKPLESTTSCEFVFDDTNLDVLSDALGYAPLKKVIDCLGALTTRTTLWSSIE